MRIDYDIINDYLEINYSIINKFVKFSYDALKWIRADDLNIYSFEKIIEERDNINSLLKKHKKYEKEFLRLILKKDNALIIEYNEKEMLLSLWDKINLVINGIKEIFNVGFNENNYKEIYDIIDIAYFELDEYSNFFNKEYGDLLTKE